MEKLICPECNKEVTKSYYCPECNHVIKNFPVTILDYTIRTIESFENTNIKVCKTCFIHEKEIKTISDCIQSYRECSNCKKINPEVIEIPKVHYNKKIKLK